MNAKNATIQINFFGENMTKSLTRGEMALYAKIMRKKGHSIESIRETLHERPQDARKGLKAFAKQDKEVKELAKKIKSFEKEYGFCPLTGKKIKGDKI